MRCAPAAIRRSKQFPWRLPPAEAAEVAEAAGGHMAEAATHVTAAEDPMAPAAASIREVALGVAGLIQASRHLLPGRWKTMLPARPIVVVIPAVLVVYLIVVPVV